MRNVEPNWDFIDHFVDQKQLCDLREGRAELVFKIDHSLKARCTYGESKNTVLKAKEKWPIPGATVRVDVVTADFVKSCGGFTILWSRYCHGVLGDFGWDELYLNLKDHRGLFVGLLEAWAHGSWPFTAICMNRMLPARLPLRGYGPFCVSQTVHKAP